MNRILFAAGGTAGHIEPAWATSLVWQKLHPGDEIGFLGTKNGLEVTLIPERGGKLFLIPKVVAPRKLNLDAALFPIRIINSVMQTLKIVKRYDIVVGFGGYVAASAYFAAFISRKPIVLHEQNAKVGIANKIGARFAKDVAVAYPTSLKTLKTARVVGNPLRPELVNAAIAAEQNWQQARRAAKNKLGVEGKVILVLGGSQGSRAINEVISDALPALNNYTIIHSVGGANMLPESSANYRPTNYIGDMATALLAADLVISRSGAIATSEFAALGKYALFIPLPIGNGEQALNAAELVAAHHAEVISQREFTSNWLASNIERLVNQGDDAAYGAPLNSANLICESIEAALK